VKPEYSKQFYTRRADRAARSAQALVPLIVARREGLLGQETAADRVGEGAALAAAE